MTLFSNWVAAVHLCAALACTGIVPAAAQTLQDVHRCDELAAHPADVNRWAEGVEDEKIVPAMALKFCTEAVEKFPSEPRFKFQLGRALQAAGRYDEVVAYFNEAGVENGYAPALAYLGIALINGWGGLEQDVDAARELLNAAVNGGFDAAGDVLAALDAPDLPFDGDAFPQRKTRYLKPFDAAAFTFPPFAQALFDGDFDTIPRPLGVIYIRKFHGLFAPEERQIPHYDDPACPLVYDSSVEARAKLEVTGATLIVITALLKELASNPEAQRATGQVAEGFVRYFYDMDATSGIGAVLGLVVLEAKLEELNGKVRYDAEQFILKNGCESPVAQRFLGNLKAYVLGTPPQQSPEVAERVSIRNSSSQLTQSCVKEFASEKFCACAIDQLMSSNLDSQTWQRIANAMRDMTKLPPTLGLRDKMRACYG